MKRLILMRHAKSDWSAAGDDHARPLNKRGLKSAPAMGAWMQDAGWVPDEILCSTATRTRQTLDLLGLRDTPTRLERRLYLAHAKDMIAVLQTAQADTVLLVGHNHGIADCAHQLVQDWPDHPRFGDYPTCATSLMTCDVSRWSDIAPGTCACHDFAIPREVMADQS